jgi:hypothetical protein
MHNEHVEGHAYVIDTIEQYMERKKDLTLNQVLVPTLRQTIPPASASDRPFLLLMQVVVKWKRYGILRKQYISQEQESSLLQPSSRRRRTSMHYHWVYSNVL